jgi:hypothetical protein
MKTCLFVVLGTIALMLAAFINGYPIVYSDTSTYLASGFELKTPFDRPITYGLFIKLTSLNGVSLWLVIFAQTLLLSFLLFKLLKEIFNGDKFYLLVGLISTILLALFTSISWTTCQLIPDIFTAILILSTIIILISKAKRIELFLFYFLFLLSVSMHMSHPSLIIVILILILILCKFNFLPLKNTLTTNRIYILIVLAFVSIGIMGSAFSKSKHVFFMGALVEHGIVKQYLDETCHTKNYKLCAYKDSLPEKAWQFIWSESSPFYKIGGWKETKQEFNEIIINTLTSPKYISLHIQESAKATFDQLLKFKIGDGNGVFLKGTLLHERISKYVPSEAPQYERSLQNQSKLNLIDSINIMEEWVIIISLAGVIFLFVRRMDFNKKFLSLITIILVTIIINAWICGTCCNAIDRLGSKVIWLITFLVLIGFAIKMKNTFSSTIGKSIGN